MKKRPLVRFILFVVGLSTLGLGARLLLLSDIGTGGIDALAVGLGRILGLSVGTVMNLISIILILIGGILKKRSLEWKPIITSIFYGIIFDVWGWLIFNQLTSPILPSQKGLMFLFGLIVAPIGSALYILMDISTSSIDYLMLAITQRYGFSVQNSRILLEVLFVISAWLVRGPIGIGTICIMLLFGPILQIYMKGLKPILIKLTILQLETKPVGIKIQKYGLKKK